MQRFPRFNRPGLRGNASSALLGYVDGDGSTLTLDFTTGQLDPRLTFTRTSNATFINSSGFVAWAAANIMTYSQSQDNNSFWNAFGTAVTRTAGQSDPLGGTGAVKLDYNATAADAVISRTVSVDNGIQYTLSVWLRSDSGTVTNVRLGRASAAAGAFFPTLTTTWQRFSLPFTASSASDGIELRVLTAGSPQTASFHVFGAQLEPGAVVRDYQPALAAAPYQAPRFDHDPTTLAPRGLLIEGTATNIALYSEYINPNAAPWNVYWFVAGAGSSVTPVSQADPANTTTASRCVLGVSGGRVYNGISTSAGVTYTLSFWAKSVSGPTSLAFWHFHSATGNSTSVTVTTSWQRYQVSILGRTGGGFVEFGIANNTGTAATVDLWGLQVETGSGASSYIPTVASTVQRLRDEVVLSSLPGIAFNQSAGTIYSQLEIVEKLRGSFVPYGSFDTSGGGRCWWWLRHNHDAGVGQRILGTAFNSGGSAAITSTNYTHSSGVFKFATSLDPVAGRMVYAIAGGSAQVTNASGFTLATAAQMSLNKNNDVAATDLGSMWVRSIKYWPTALPDATLQSLST